jgi:hypothetical protein
MEVFGLSLTEREGWTAVHGLLGTLVLIGFSGGLAGVWSLRTTLLTSEGLRERLSRLMPLSWLMALGLWATVITGTWIVYIWYRDPPPEGTTGEALREYPRYYLLSDEDTEAWHTFGMELKEHIAWWTPMLATAAAFIIWRYRGELSVNRELRRLVFGLFVLTLLVTLIAEGFGAFITKVAPLV